MDKKLGRDGSRLATLVLLADKEETRSWLDMSTDIPRMIAAFKGCNVGRHIALEVWEYRSGDSGDTLHNRVRIAEQDRGYWGLDGKQVGATGPIKNWPNPYGITVPA